ncbi:hypothetical protein TRS1_20 [Acinetobacter phage vB_AbaS_TRS1]|nr:hypothetical protein TRS1_20 [Acinetobacter phage vB_AbaS_TRS1]ANT40732.1 hypothetical protein TRS1_20 [Acinetobacter phage vB_AbaS_TRS1]
MLHNTAIPLTTTIRFDIDTSVISTYYSFKRNVYYCDAVTDCDEYFI